MEGATDEAIGKMGFGVLRYSPNPVICAIDSVAKAASMEALGRSPRPCPIVANLEQAISLGAEVLVLGTAPPGGQIPEEWIAVLESAVESGLSIVNGLHDRLSTRFGSLQAGQWVWDVRMEPSGLGIGSAAAAQLRNLRCLMVGSDMAIGKMTAGLEIVREAQLQGIRAEFVATGQIGIVVTGRGIPLDAIRIDYASGAVEREVLRASEGADWVIVEGQGSLVHPGSSSNLPLLRGSCPTHLVLCHRAFQTHLFRLPHIKIPPLGDLIRLFEDLAEACGTFPRPSTIGIALNTSAIEDDVLASDACRAIEDEVGLPCVDPVRHGPQALIDRLKLASTTAL
jgi:uncharacterized NAD-dependent epimerase/dehydratase family protein